MAAPTVYDRMKSNGGYVMGPNHMMNRQPDQMMKSEKDSTDTEDGANKAPNYREFDTPGENCKSCDHFDQDTSQCELYNFTAKPYMVCDSYESEGSEDNEGDTSDDSSEEEVMERAPKQ